MVDNNLECLMCLDHRIVLQVNSRFNFKLANISLVIRLHSDYSSVGIEALESIVIRELNHTIPTVGLTAHVA